MPRPSETILLKEAQKDLDRLQPDVRTHVLGALARLSDNPNLGKRLSGGLKAGHSYRFGTPSGEFRATFLHRSNQLIVLAIGPRGSFYQKLTRRIY